MDDGKTWDKISDDMFWQLSVTSDNTLVANLGYKLFKSNDQGSSWQYIPTPLNFISEFTLKNDTLFYGGYNGTYENPVCYFGYLINFNNAIEYLLPNEIKSVYELDIIGNTVYLGSYLNGTYKSYDLGSAWDQISTVGAMGLICFDNTVIIGANDGIYYSEDSGNTFNLASMTVTSIEPPMIYAILRLSSGLLIAGSYGCSGEEGGKGVFVSDDNGKNWYQSIQGMDRKSVQNLALSPDESKIYVGIGYGDASWPAGVYKSDINVVGIENNSNSGIQIYPNPAHEKLFLSLGQTLSSKVNEISIVNTLGRPVSRIKLINQDHLVELSLKGYKPGLYFVILSGEQLKSNSVIKFTVLP
jgi:hypothetical protein